MSWSSAKEDEANLSQGKWVLCHPFVVHLFVHVTKKYFSRSYHVQGTLAEFSWDFHHSGSPKANEGREMRYGEKVDTGLGGKGHEKVMNCWREADN